MSTLVVGPIRKGLQNNVTAFNVDNDAFPTLVNAYQWRGRIKRKRGTSLIGRLKYIVPPTLGNTSASPFTFNLNVFFPVTGGTIVPGTVVIVWNGSTYTDQGDGTLTSVTAGSSGTINYATTSTTLINATGGAPQMTVNFSYYPNLPVMGLRDFDKINQSAQGTIAFDTTYAYSINPADPYPINNVNFYDNPATLGTYNAKSTWTELTWNGQDYQQFYTANYQGALFTTNGVTNPFVTTNIGMQYKPCATVVYGSATTLTITISEAVQTLVVGDYVFINEVTGTNNYTVNFQTGYVTAAANAASVTTLTVTFPNATISNQTYSNGILQYLTNNADTTKDCIRWYNGDSTSGTGTPSVNGVGWVNYCPPLSRGDYSISDLPPDQYYLVGCKAILPFQDRLLFFGVVVQTSSANSQVYLKDTIVWSQNGSPYYTASFAATSESSVNSISTTFNPILVPTNQTAVPSSFFSDITGYGGFLAAYLDQAFMTVAQNEDVLILGFTRSNGRFISTDNDFLPFRLYIIDSNYGSTSTFSAINLDTGVLTKGNRGYIVTTQTGTQRFDEDVPDEVFNVAKSNNGNDRVCAQRDYIGEWVYFTYPIDSNIYKFPTQTLFFNYRDNSWAVFNECYTCYGAFRPGGRTWATIGNSFKTWSSWNQPWNYGSGTNLNPIVIGGNQQGFVLQKNIGTSEALSLQITAISGNTITSPNHCLNSDDFIMIEGCLGVTDINDLIFKVKPSLSDANSFDLVNNGTTPSGTYLGGGQIRRYYKPLIQTKQFPVSWEMMRKTRLGVQQYLFTKTANSQITVYIFLSQSGNFSNDGNEAFNQGGVTPGINVVNGSLVYSSTLYTCPEGTNLGLTPANVNLNMITGQSQGQIWHRMNTSLIGDTVQIGFSMSDEQMTSVGDNGEPINAVAEIEFHSMILSLFPSQLLC